MFDKVAFSIFPKLKVMPFIVGLQNIIYKLLNLRFWLSTLGELLV